MGRDCFCFGHFRKLTVTPNLSSVPKDSAQVIRHFGVATSLAPKNAVFWQSLGDALHELHNPYDSVDRTNDVVADYQKSLAK